MPLAIIKKYQTFRWLAADLTLSLANAPWLSNVLKVIAYTAPNSAGLNAQSTYTGAYNGQTPGGTLTKLVQNMDYLLISGVYNGSWSLPTSVAVATLPNLTFSLAVTNQRQATVTLPPGDVITDYEFEFVPDSQVTSTVSPTA